MATDYVPGLGMPADEVQELLARVDLMSETILYTRYEKEEPVSTYEVAPASLAAAFSGIPVSTGLLPKNTMFYEMDGLEESVCVYLPPTKRKLIVKGIDQTATVLMVPLPPLVFAGKGNGYAVFAVKQRPGEDDLLYHAPLPNVYTTGLICRGTAAFVPCTTRTVYQAAKAFFESDFNFHLVNRKSQKHPDDVIAMWRELDEATADAWPLDDLVLTQWAMRDLVSKSLFWRRG